MVHTTRTSRRYPYPSRGDGDLFAPRLPVGFGEKKDPKVSRWLTLLTEDGEPWVRVRLPRASVNAVLAYAALNALDLSDAVEELLREGIRALETDPKTRSECRAPKAWRVHGGRRPPG